MKKTIYIPILQYTSSRHHTFLQCLCDHFTVIVSKMSPVSLYSPNIEWVEDILLEANGETGNTATQLNFDAEYKSLCMFAKNTIDSIMAKDVSFEAVQKHTDQYKSELKTIFNEAVQLLNVSRKRQIDFVISSCDYAYLSRPAVHMAKTLGIHTVDIEHGYFGIKLNPTAWHPPRKMQRPISDTVIVDNELEANLFKQYRMPYSTQKYVPLGTPMDHAYKHTNVSRTESLDALGLDENKKTIALALSWLMPSSLDGLVANHELEVGFVETVLQLISSHSKYKNVQLVIKLHPAVRNFREDKHVHRFYNALVSRHKLQHSAKVTAVSFDEVLPGVDGVIGWTMSSVLFDTAMEGKPVAQYQPQKYKETYREDPNLHSEMAKAGLFRILFSKSDLENYLDTVLSKDFHQIFKSNKEQFSKKWKIVHQTVQQKSERIVDWLKSIDK